MSLSPEDFEGKNGNRDAGALARQRRMICVLFIWSTLLTLGFATCLVFQFFNGASLDHGNIEKLSAPTLSSVMAHRSTTQSSDVTSKLIIFDPDWDNKNPVDRLKWKTNFLDFITGGEQLTIKEDGLYFLYLQVTLIPKQNHTVTVEVNNKDPILSSQITQTKPSTGLMGKGFTFTKGDKLSVTCTPGGHIINSPTQTYLGVIKIG